VPRMGLRGEGGRGAASTLASLLVRLKSKQTIFPRALKGLGSDSGTQGTSTSPARRGVRAPHTQRAAILIPRKKRMIKTRLCVFGGRGEPGA